MTQTETRDRIPSEPETRPRELPSTVLFRGAKVLEINHAGERYLLRITRQNKLILTK